MPESRQLPLVRDEELARRYRVDLSHRLTPLELGFAELALRRFPDPDRFWRPDRDGVPGSRFGVLEEVSWTVLGHAAFALEVRESWSHPLGERMAQGIADQVATFVRRAVQAHPDLAREATEVLHHA